MRATDELIDLIGRIMFAHCIAPEYLQKVLGGDLAEAEAIVVGKRRPHRSSAAEIARLELFASILVRLEWRVQGESHAMRGALARPIDVLDGAAPGDLLSGGIDNLRQVRTAIDTIEAPKVRWWRVGH